MEQRPHFQIRLFEVVLAVVTLIVVAYALLTLLSPYRPDMREAASGPIAVAPLPN